MLINLFGTFPPFPTDVSFNPFSPKRDPTTSRCPKLKASRTGTPPTGQEQPDRSGSARIGTARADQDKNGDGYVSREELEAGGLGRCFGWTFTGCEEVETPPDTITSLEVETGR